MAANPSLLTRRVSMEWPWFPGVQYRREWRRMGWSDSWDPTTSDRYVLRSRRRVLRLRMKTNRQKVERHMSTRDNDGSIELNITTGGETKLRNDSEATISNNQAKCEVETVSWRERLIKARILVEAAEERVWEVLTDYERLAEFIPNLVCSERISCPYPGRIWLLQRGMQRTMYWNIQASVILDLEELPYLEAGRELRFSMVDGDFKKYQGKWYLQQGPRPQTTMLHYEVNVVPRLFFPAAFVESIIKADLPKNLFALAKRAEMRLESISRNSAKSKLALLKENFPSNVRVSLPSFSGKDIGKGNAIHVDDLHWTGIGQTCQLSHQCLADEIHYRRLDDLLEKGGVHRQVVATITVKAPIKDVWAVLSAYESLPEFIPNLTTSVVLFRENRQLQLLQEGCKCLLFMVLHARVILELVELPEWEIAFKQVEGDFDSFQGKWTLSKLGTQHTLLKYAVNTKIRKDCLLAESIVEEVVYEDLPSNLCALRDRVESLAKSSDSDVGLSESETKTVITECDQMTASQSAPASALIEELPNLEDVDVHAETSADSKPQKGKRPKKLKGSAPRGGPEDDFQLLEKEVREFVTAYGNEGFMPTRRVMRQQGRIDLEKAITAMGGFATIAARMKLSLAYERRPTGYWGNLQNLRNEVISFQKEVEGELIMPTRRSMERSGRFDLARALEKWGGLQEVARITGLKTRGKNMRTCPPTKEVEKKLLSKASSDKNVCLSTTSKSAHKGFSQQPSNMSLTTSLEVSGEPQFLSEKDKSISSNSIEEHYLVSNSMTSSGNQGKHKKMPYKTGIPQESSKWLTLVDGTDSSTSINDTD